PPSLRPIEAVNREPRSAAERLAAQKVFVSVRGQSLRVTPHLYNDDIDAEALLSAFARVNAA
ncbi:MAG: aminotransferase, partial [Pseudomonadota bacterium]